MRHFVHVSGYTLAEQADWPALNADDEPIEGTWNDWEKVCWGDPDTLQLGRIPMALAHARNVSAEAVIWSTGASKRATDRASEARVHFENARERFSDLRGFFPHRFTRRTWNSESAYRAWLSRVSSFDETSRNTLQSMHVLKRMIDDATRKPEHITIHLVSSANHIPRVIRDAMKAFNIGMTDQSFVHRVTLAAVPADTCYGKNYFVDRTITDDLGKMYVERRRPGVQESE